MVEVEKHEKYVNVRQCTQFHGRCTIVQMVKRGGCVETRRKVVSFFFRERKPRARWSVWSPTLTASAPAVPHHQPTPPPPKTTPAHRTRPDRIKPARRVSVTGPPTNADDRVRARCRGGGRRVRRRSGKAELQCAKPGEGDREGGEKRTASFFTTRRNS